MVHIPYRGAAPALTDLMGGQIQLFFDAASGLINPGKTGKVRLIGVASDRRLPALPDVPTFIEQGVAGFTGSTWAGMLAPAGTPKEIVKRVSDEVAQIVRLDDVKARLEAMGTIPVGGTPEEFEAFIAAETDEVGQGDPRREGGGRLKGPGSRPPRVADPPVVLAAVAAGPGPPARPRRVRRPACRPVRARRRTRAPRCSRPRRDRCAGDRGRSAHRRDKGTWSVRPRR